MDLDQILYSVRRWYKLVLVSFDVFLKIAAFFLSFIFFLYGMVTRNSYTVNMFFPNEPISGFVSFYIGKILWFLSIEQFFLLIWKVFLKEMPYNLPMLYLTKYFTNVTYIFMESKSFVFGKVTKKTTLSPEP